MSIKLCDFCGEPDPEWDYPTDQFTMNMAVLDDDNDITSSTTFNYDPDWLACNTCANFIEESKWAALANRSIVKAAENNVRLVRDVVIEMHKHFLVARKGRSRIKLT